MDTRPGSSKRKTVITPIQSGEKARSQMRVVSAPNELNYSPAISTQSVPNLSGSLQVQVNANASASLPFSPITSEMIRMMNAHSNRPRSDEEGSERSIAASLRSLMTKMGKQGRSSTNSENRAQPNGSMVCMSTHCTHPSHANFSKVTAIDQIPTEHYTQQVQRLQEEAASKGYDTALISGKLNGIFMKRLQEIDVCASGDKELKLVTYQEWVDMLLSINRSIINNMEGMEAEVSERLETMRTRVQQRESASTKELCSLRKDVNLLLKFIRNAYCTNSWDLEGYEFETISPTEILSNDPVCPCTQEDPLYQEVPSHNEMGNFSNFRSRGGDDVSDISSPRVEKKNATPTAKKAHDSPPKATPQKQQKGPPQQQIQQKKKQHNPPDDNCGDFRGKEQLNDLNMDGDGHNSNIGNVGSKRYNNKDMSKTNSGAHTVSKSKNGAVARDMRSQFESPPD